MRDQSPGILCAVFLLFFIFSITESHLWKVPENFEISKNNISDERNLGIYSNYSERASCNCKNGDCDDNGKGCVCWPDYGKVSEDECQACNCGKGHGCTITTGWFGKTTCICKKGFVVKDKKCVDVNTVCDCGSGLCVEEDGKAVCKCKPMYGFIETQKKCIACNCGKGWNCSYSYSGSVKNCICTNGYKQKGTGMDRKCVALTGCEDNGGNKECQEKGEFFTCINDEQDVSKYRCECQPGYKIKNKKCIALTGCEDNGGNKECHEKGEFFTCINDEQGVSKYRCECHPGYRIENTKCVAYSTSSTVSVSSYPTSTKTIANSTTTETSTTEVQKKKCDCGENSYACQWNKKGAQLCSCFPGYAQLGNICSECHCGKNTASCFFDRNERNICICRDGFAQRNGTCSKICRSSAECLNGGQCSSDGHESFCKCMSPYTGDRCEINEICESMNGACDSIGGVCHYIHSIKQGFCICPPNKIFKEDLKRCEDKFEVTSIFFIILCLSTVLLLLSIVILIILLKKFRKKLESLNGKSP
ncbi:fibropellin-1-like isoform X1 [Parasteatoda tepidariorum]|uniref:fibropellin-1-like isoform X1 n=1 Tax=Parasteatoda tepidariorum TaxID=114398 RepID=UPI0039BCFBD8